MSEKFPYWRCCDNIFNLRKEEYDSKNFTEQEIQAVELYKEYYLQYYRALGEKSRLNIEIDIASKLSHSHTRIMTQLAKSQLAKSQLEDKMLFLEEKLAYLELCDDIQSVLDKVDTPRNIIKTTFADEYFENTTQIEKAPKPIFASENHIEQSKKEFPVFSVLPMVIAFFLLISAGDLPYGFYQFMRIVVPLLSVIYLFFAYSSFEKFDLWLIPNAIITILWNPICPIYLDKETWVVIDIVAAICELIVAVYSYYSWKKNT